MQHDEIIRLEEPKDIFPPMSGPCPRRWTQHHLVEYGDYYNEK